MTNDYIGDLASLLIVMLYIIGIYMHLNKFKIFRGK